MSRDKVHILHFPKRPARQQRSRVPTDLLFLIGLGIAFVAAHYSDKPPLVEQPLSVQRGEGPRFAEQNLIGVRVLETGLRGFER